MLYIGYLFIVMNISQKIRFPQFPSFSCRGWKQDVPQPLRSKIGGFRRHMARATPA